MIIDAHGIFGRFGIVAKGVWDIGEYLETLDKFKIDISLVSSTLAMLHDVKRGNEEILKICSEHEDRLKPVVTGNPRWGKEEIECFLDDGAFAIKLEPAFHRYSIADEYVMEPVLNVCRKRKLPLMVNAGLCCAAHVYGFMPMATARDFCVKNPDIKILLMGLPYEETCGMINFMKKHKNLYLDTAMLYGGRFTEKLVENGLEGRVCMGTEYGVQSPAAGMSVVQDAEIPDSAKKKILGLNIMKLFNLRNEE